MSNILENIELNNNPKINPKTKYYYQLHAPTKNTDTLISRVAKYPSRQHTNNNIRNAIYIVSVEELGLMKSVKIEPSAAKLMKSTAMNTVMSMVARPKNNK